MNETLQHLVMVRHGMGEGDERRAAWRAGKEYPAANPDYESLTKQGEQQNHLSGHWIAHEIMERYGIVEFDACITSHALRSEQSAVALNLESALWLADSCLDERNRGKVRGIRPEEHRRLYPESYAQMKADPLHWRPPEGETLIPEVHQRAKKCFENIDGLQTVLAVGHRDQMWVSLMELAGLDEAGLLEFNSDHIDNAQVWHFMAPHPDTGQPSNKLSWFRSINPSDPTTDTGWLELPLSIDDVRKYFPHGGSN